MRSLIIGSQVQEKMMRPEGKRLWTTVALVGLLAGLCLSTATTPAHAHSDWAAPFMGGIMAGGVLSHIAEQKERQAQAMQEMARGGGYGGYAGYGGGFAGYGGGYGRPAYGPPSQYGPPSPYGAPAGCR